MAKIWRKYAIGDGLISAVDRAVIQTETKTILILNAGSTSVKVGLFEAADSTGAEPELELLWSGQVDSGDGGLWALTSAVAFGGRQSRKLEVNSFEDAMEVLVESALKENQKRSISIVGHRVVHGGSKYNSSVLIDDVVVNDLKSLVNLAPKHERSNLSGIELSNRLFNGIPQVAVFDTAFHQSIPQQHRIYPLPYEWFRDWGIKRYGFHGISHQYCAIRVAEMLGRPLDRLRVITCHLGGGASLAAISGGACQMTTMGYTPLEGLMMSTRAGSVDVGIILQLLIDRKLTAEEMLRVLNEESGLKGISGLSGDLREIQVAAESNQERAKLALEIYAASLHKHIGSLIAVLGGVDAIAFTGGIGENSDWVRAAACEPFEFLGLRLDPVVNAGCRKDEIISLPDAEVAALVVKAREELAIARECLRVSQSFFVG